MTSKQHLLQDYFSSHGERLSQSQRVALEDFALWMDGARPVHETPAPQTHAEKMANEHPAAASIAEMFKSRLFQQFLEQGFWHARSVDLIWRYNGQDVREEADWLKDIWYAIRGAQKTPAEPAARACSCDEPLSETCLAKYFKAGITCRLTGEKTLGMRDKCEHGIPRRFCTAVHES